MLVLHVGVGRVLGLVQHRHHVLIRQRFVVGVRVTVQEHSLGNGVELNDTLLIESLIVVLHSLVRDCPADAFSRSFSI